MKVLSYGGGINSTAILALVKLGKYPMPDRIIFCDTGAERPETYCYMKYITKIFPNIEIHKRKENLIEQLNHSGEEKTIHWKLNGGLPLNCLGQEYQNNCLFCFHSPRH